MEIFHNLDRPLGIAGPVLMLGNFDGVRRRFPKGEKVPAALLKQGLSFAELNDRLDARLILQELVDRFPDSEEAAKAKQRLKTLESPPARPEPPAGRDAPGSRTAPPARR